MLTTCKIGAKESEGGKLSLISKIVNKSLWLIGTSRNAILVIITGLVGFYFYSDDTAPFKLTGEIPAGLPSIAFPPFSVTEGNTTVGFTEMLSELGSGIIVIPLLALLENIAICKAFGKFI